MVIWGGLNFDYEFDIKNNIMYSTMIEIRPCLQTFSRNKGQYVLKL